MKPGEVLAGLLCVGCGLYPVLAVLGLLGPDPIDAAAPDWLLLIIGAMFVVTGAWVPFRHTAAGKQAGRLVGIGVVVGLFTAGNWVAFGPGERECSTSIEIPFLELETERSDLGCRIPFGWGAVLMNGVLLVIVASGLEKRVGKHPALTALDRTGWAVVLLALSPLLVVLLITALAGGGKTFVAERWAKLRGRASEG